MKKRTESFKTSFKLPQEDQFWVENPLKFELYILLA